MNLSYLRTGLPAFTLIAFGQLISLTGSEVANFAFTLWAFEKTGLATSLTLMGLFHFLPLILISPFAGALVDRGNRRLMMMLSDLGSAAATLLLLGLEISGNLQIWHLYLGAAITGLFTAFQWPAFSAAISTMVEKKDYGRANGMLSLAQSASTIGAPILGALLYAAIGLGGVLWLDLLSFGFAFATLLFVRVPQPPQSAAGLESRGNLLSEAVYGFRYIFSRPSLLALQTVFLLINLVSNLGGGAVMSAMVLSRTANNEAALATVFTSAGIGGVLGGIWLSVWGGPKRRVHGVLLGMMASSFCAILQGAGQSVWFWAAAAFASAPMIHLLNASNQSIWQSKVPPDIQGKVFSARRMIAWIATPIAMLIAGPLADRVFTPAMMEGGALAPVFGGLVGVGPGAGLGLLIALMGVLGMAIAAAAFWFPVVRDAEDLIPDHDAVKPDPAPA